MQNFIENTQLKEMIRYALYNGDSRYGKLECTEPKTKTTHDLLTITQSVTNSYACSKPRITGISKGASVPTTKSLLLKCNADGSPKPQIEWKAPNGDTYRLTADDFEGVTVHSDGSILIEDIRRSDRGEYFCMAKNSQGQVEASTKIEVTGDDPDNRDSNRDDEDWDNWEEGPDDVDWIDGNLFDDEGKNVNAEYHWDDLYTDKDITDDMSRETIFEYKECPIGCECMSNLADCGGSGQIVIPKTIPTHILHLDMNNNDIKKVGYDVCRNYKTLRELKVDDNQIVEIADKAFTSCSKLTILTMRNNRLVSLPEGTVSINNLLLLLNKSCNIIHSLMG